MRRARIAGRCARSHYENFTVASWLLPKAAAAAFSSFVRILSLGGRLGRRIRIPGRPVWPCSTGGNGNSTTITRVGPGIRCSWRSAETIREFEIPKARWRICWSRSGRINRSRSTRRSTSCWDTAATRRIRWDGSCCTWAAARTVARGALGFDLHWAATGQFLAGRWPVIGRRGAFICLRKTPEVRVFRCGGRAQKFNDAFRKCWRSKSIVRNSF